MRPRPLPAAAHEAASAEKRALEAARRSTDQASTTGDEAHDDEATEGDAQLDAEFDALLASIDWADDRGAAPAAVEATPAQVREWARRQGYDVGARGRLRPEVIDA